MEITIQELKQIENYLLIDMRDKEQAQKNPMDGSIQLSQEEIEQTEFDKTKPIVVVCAQGQLSIPVVAYLREKGYEAYSLQGGYISFVMEQLKQNRSDDFCRQVERSIIKTYRKKIWSKFTKAIKTYELVQEGDSIAVCISGGKDSMLMAKCFQELHKHGPIHFDVKYIVMDPGYSPTNRHVIEENAKKLQIPIQIFTSDIFENVFHIEKNPCYICARMRRGHLYNYAQQLGCNKIALGHHYDDVIETILMGMMYAGQIQTMMPKLKSENFEGMELIRPMYLIREKDIMNWRDYNNLHFIQCACHFTDTCSSCREDGTSNSKRMETKKLIEQLKKTNPVIEKNIFKSVENINLHNVISYKTDDGWHNFLDDYKKDK